MASPSAVAARVAPESFYDWTAPDQPVSFSINLNLIDLLSLEMIEAFKSIPRRGLEIGGILLGHIDTSGEKPVVVVEDRELLPSEHLHGPSFRLSSPDRDQLTALATKWSVESNASFHIVGLFRGDTRPEHKFDEQDTAIARDLAPGGQGVFLMIAPAAGHIGQATVGILKDGELVPAGEFPFRSASLREGSFPINDRNVSQIAVERRSPARPVPPSTSGEEREPGAAPAAGRVLDLATYRTRSRPKNWRTLPVGTLSGPAFWSREFWSQGFRKPAFWKQAFEERPHWNSLQKRAWIPISIAAAILVLFLAVQRHRTTHPAAVLPSIVTAAKASLVPIRLSVKREGPEWNLTWNHTSELIEQADRGALKIYDGPSSWELPLDRSELRTGSIRYLPKSGRVKFELQVVSPDRSASESIIALDSGYQPARTETAKTAADRGPSSPQRSKKAGRQIQARPALPLRASVLSAPASTHNVISLPDPPRLSSTPLVPASRAPLGREHSPEMRLAVTTAFEPAGPSRIRKALKFVSPTRLVRRHEAVEVRAAPIREVKPVALLQPGWHGSVEVDVRVAIDPQGKVSGAWVESPQDSSPLSDAALTAARNWRFRPATKNNATVESEAILHFRFQNPDVAAIKP